MATNLTQRPKITLGRIHASEKLFTATYLWWFKTLHSRLAHGDDKPYTEDFLLLVTNLTEYLHEGVRCRNSIKLGIFQILCPIP